MRKFNFFFWFVMFSNLFIFYVKYDIENVSDIFLLNTVKLNGFWKKNSWEKGHSYSSPLAPQSSHRCESQKMRNCWNIKLWSFLMSSTGYNKHQHDLCHNISGLNVSDSWYFNVDSTFVAHIVTPSTTPQTALLCTY